MPKKPTDKNAALICVRVHEDDTLKLINELAVKFKNRNAVLNDALNIGVPILYARIFGKDVKQASEQEPHNPSVGREIKELRKVIDDVFVQMLSVETMVAGLFNAKTDELNGDEVSAAGLLDGSGCELPEFVAGLKDDLTRSDK